MTPEPIACTLTPAELQREAADLLPGLIAQAEAADWLPEGIRLTFKAEAGLLARVAAVIERERGCCRFFAFRLDVAAGSGPVTLEVTGPPGTRGVLEALPGVVPSGTT